MAERVELDHVVKRCANPRWAAGDRGVRRPRGVALPSAGALGGAARWWLSFGTGASSSRSSWAVCFLFRAGVSACFSGFCEDL